MIKYEQALEIIDKKVKPLNKIIIKRIEKSLNYILAEDIISDINLPPFTRSLRDGFVLNINDFNIKNSYEIIGTITADLHLQAIPKPQKNQIYKILTGAPVPEWANTVIMFEDSEINNNKVNFKIIPKFNDYIVFEGSDSKSGEILIKKNTKITDYMIPLFASVGYRKISVYDKPKVSIIITGSELVAPDEKPKNGQIRDGNLYSLKSLLRDERIKIENKKVIPDKKDKIKKNILKFIVKCDLLIINGGISMGDCDYVRDILHEICDEILFYKVALKPGKPVFLGKFNEKYILALPGNPISTIVTIKTIAFCLIKKLANENQIKQESIYAISNFDYNKNTQRLHFLPGNIFIKNNKTYFELNLFNSSGDVVSSYNSNHLAIIPKETTEIKKGEILEILL